MNLLRSFVSATMVLTVVFFAACDRHEDVADQIPLLEARIDSLRIEGKFDQALAAADELLALRRRDRSSKPYQVADAERLLSTLESISTLSIADQQDLARAYGLMTTWEEFYPKEELKSAIAEQRKTLANFLGDEHPDVGMVLVAITSDFYKYYILADDPWILAITRETVATYRRVLGPNHPQVAESLIGLANLLLGGGDGAGADSLRREALEIQRRTLGPDHPEVGKTFVYLAMFSRKENHSEAQAFIQNALTIYRKAIASLPEELAESLNGLADLYWSDRSYNAPRFLMEAAVAIHRKVPSRYGHDAVRSLNFVSGFLRDGTTRRPDPAGAESAAKAALEVYRLALCPDHPRVAMTFNILADFCKKRGNYAEADSLYREALGVNERVFGRDHPKVAWNLDNLADLAKERGDKTSAYALYRRALEIRRTALGPDHRDVARSLHNLASVTRSKGEHAMADSLDSKGHEIRRGAYGYGAWARERLYVGKDCFYEGDYALAEKYLSEAATAYEIARRRVQAGREHAFYLRSPYPTLALTRLALGESQDAWADAERSLGRYLADILLVSEKRSLSAAEAALEDSLLETLTNLDSQLEILGDVIVTDPSPETIADYEEARERLVSAEDAWSSFQAHMREKYPVTEGEPYPLKRIQTALDRETAIMAWLEVIGEKGPLGSWAYVIRHRGPVVWSRLKSSKEEPNPTPYERSKWFREELSLPDWAGQRTDSTSQSALEQWRLNVAPISHALEGVTKLVIIPSGLMLGIPIEAVVDDTGTYLGDRFSISYTPSATLHSWLKERGSTQKGFRASESLLVGDPPFQLDQLAQMETNDDAVTPCLAPTGPRTDRSVLREVLAGNEEARRRLERLPCTRLEVEAVAPMVPHPTILVGRQATEQELVRLAQLDRLKDFSVIHLATHALVDQQHPEQSALVLSQVDLPDPPVTTDGSKRAYDGLVRAKEILREWSLNSDLVTLSGCETALDVEVRGKGYVGLAHTFLQTGARSLIVSLWPVEDRATSLLMERFYENWAGKYADVRNGYTGEPMSKADALQEAKRYVRSYTENDGRRPFEHPYYWAAFILIGERE